MRLPSGRTFLAVGATVAVTAFFFIVLALTDWAFEVFNRLRSAPGWFIFLYALFMLSLVGSGGWIVWKLLYPKPKSVRTAPPAPPPTQEEVERRIAKTEQMGLDVGVIRRELAELKNRRAAGEIHIALFGEISTGKSSLVRALLPTAEVEVSARGGTTREVTRHVWASTAQDRLILTDLPGLNEATGTLDTVSKEEATRAHVVIYVCDGDLTRDQYQELQALLALNKPTVLALNKIDLYTEEELALIRQRLAERVQGSARVVEVVAIRAGGKQEVLKVYPDGREEKVIRELPPRVTALAEAVQRCIDADLGTLEKLRDSAVFVLAARKLDEAVASHRHGKAEELISHYSRKAVLGAMAAVAPGTDLLIQGYLGVNLLRELCELYEVPVREIDLQCLLKQSGKHVAKTLPIMLAVAGNGLKAFPGLGTVAGGLLHAVAYGLIFDSLGKAVTYTLETRGDLQAAPAVLLFEEKLGEDLEARARKFARMALTGQISHRNDSGDHPGSSPGSLSGNR
ncbi:GTP-binding protein [Gammaproteobacteria bacterium]